MFVFWHVCLTVQAFVDVPLCWLAVKGSPQEWSPLYDISSLGWLRQLMEQVVEGAGGVKKNLCKRNGTEKTEPLRARLAHRVGRLWGQWQGGLVGERQERL